MHFLQNSTFTKLGNAYVTHTYVFINVTKLLPKNNTNNSLFISIFTILYNIIYYIY